MSSVHLLIDGAIAEMRLDNPAKLNALTPAMLDQIMAHCDTVERKGDVVAVLITATGPKAFCTGADITAWADLSPADFARHWVRAGHRVFDRLARLSKPTIAVLEGPAYGGGLEMALCCDMLVAENRPTGNQRGYCAGLVRIATLGAVAAGSGIEGNGAVRACFDGRSLRHFGLCRRGI